MIQRKRKLFRKLAKSDINITPLIDILLVLLVIFMVITPVTPVGLKANVPQPPLPEAQPSQQNETLVLSVDQGGRITLNQEELSIAMIIPRLQDVFRTRNDRTLFVQADTEVIFNEVAQLIDAARGAGADRIGLLTEPISAK